MSVLKMYSNEKLFHILSFYNQVCVSNKRQKVFMKETIAKKLFITEYSEPCQTSKMERFAKIVQAITRLLNAPLYYNILSFLTASNI